MSSLRKINEKRRLLFFEAKVYPIFVHSKDYKFKSSLFTL
jgi:hypothetical protein